MTTWIFLRGLTRDRRHWGAFVETFAAAVPGATIETLDFPGNGSRHGETSPASIDDIVEACRDELERRQLPPPYQVLAMSLGAMVAIAWAARCPREIERCVLINTSVRPFARFYWRLRPRNSAAIVRLLFTDDPAQVEATILRLTSRRAAAHAAVLDDWIRFRLAAPVTRANALRQLLAAARFRAAPDAPAVPLLLLASAGDGLVDVRCSRALARAWRVELVEHADAGHDLPLDDGPWVARAVRDWIDGLRSPAHERGVGAEQGTRTDPVA